MNPLISVVLPIYNVEMFLPKCIESVITQSYENLEIILVNDGSTDNSGKICDEYANKDNRIKVVHKKNGGLSDARNAGLKEVTGKYVSYIDSDDYISKDFFEIMYKIMLEKDCDIVECGVQKVYINKNNDEVSNDDSITVYSTTDALRELINDGAFHQHVWNKLYKIECVESLLFEKGKYNEDEFWTYKAFGNARRIAKYNRAIYFYLQRPNSIMGQGYQLKRLDALEAKEDRQTYIDEKYSELSSIAKKNFYFTCFYAYKASLRWLEKSDKPTAIKKIKKYMKSIDFTSADKNLLKGKEKVRFILSRNRITFYIMCKIENMFGIGF